MNVKCNDPQQMDVVRYRKYAKEKQWGNEQGVSGQEKQAQATKSWRGIRMDG